MINVAVLGYGTIGSGVVEVLSVNKDSIAKKVGQPVWQKLFHDHVVRGYEDYREIWEYIENNPLKYALNRTP